MAQAPQNTWNNSWGSINDHNSTPPSGWTFIPNEKVWRYTGQLSNETFQPIDGGPNPPPTNTTIYLTSSVDCFPDVIVNSTGDPVVPPTGDPVVIPGTTTGTKPSTPPSPPVSPGVQPVPTFGKFYNVCFDDGLLNQKGWTRPRFEGTKLRALYYNEYTDELEEGKELSPIQNPNLDTSIDKLKFIITASHQITSSELQNTLGNPFEFDKDSGIVYTLRGITETSTDWTTEFREDLAVREKYPPKSVGGTDTNGTDTTADGINQTYQLSSSDLPVAPFGPDVYDVPLVPTSYYKLNPYTQEPEKVERKQKTFDLIPTPIKLNPVDPKGLNGGPFFLGTDPGQNEEIASNNRLPSEYQIKYKQRDYVYTGPWQHETETGQFAAGTADLSQWTSWGYNETEISRSAIIPERQSEGDITYGKSPVIENYSNAIFFGNTVYGYQQSDVFPGPGPDFSYLKLEKAYIFNSEDDSFYVQEIKSEGEDRTFQNLMQSTFPWSTDFRLKLLDYDQENNLKTSYGVHWNRGYFSEIATYTTESAHRTASGHYPGTGRNFELGDGRYVAGGNANFTGSAGSGGGPLFSQYFSLFLGNATPVANNPQGDLNEGAQFRKAPTGSDDGGYYYMVSDNGGGEGSLFYGTFKRAGADFGREEQNFPRYQTMVDAGNWKTGPGTSNFFGLDPLPGGMRYYQFRFWPVHRPVGGMSADGGTSPNSTKMLGRVLSGTFEINDKNPSADWWFEQGGEKEIKWVSESCAGDVTSSMKIFMDQCHKQDDLYILTFNEAKFVDKSFNQGFQRENHPFLKRTRSDVPGYPGDPNWFNSSSGAYEPYGDATMGTDDHIADYSYYINYVRPFNTFGSMLYSNRPEAVGVRNAHNLLAGLGDAAEIGMGWYDYSEEALEWSSTVGQTINPATGEIWSVHDEGYKGKYTGYGPMGGIYAYGINAPRFMNGDAFIQTGDRDGKSFTNDGNGTQTQNIKDAAGNVIQTNTNGTFVVDSVSVWTGYMYGNNWRHFFTGGSNGKYIDFRERKGWGGVNKWTISKLEERPNFILTDINKQEELPQGVGQKGFILIPDTLNPRIKANLDFYLSKAGLIDKERAPKHKDKSIKRNTYLPPRIKLKKPKRRGWFWKLRKNLFNTGNY